MPVKGQSNVSQMPIKGRSNATGHLMGIWFELSYLIFNIHLICSWFVFDGHLIVLWFRFLEVHLILVWWDVHLMRIRRTTRIRWAFEMRASIWLHFDLDFYRSVFDFGMVRCAFDANLMHKSCKVLMPSIRTPCKDWKGFLPKSCVVGLGHVGRVR